jgi:hypothetical protein
VKLPVVHVREPERLTSLSSDAIDVSVVDLELVRVRVRGYGSRE